MMSSPQSDIQPSKPTPTRGVWSFMKGKVWGDVPSHPVSDSGSESQRTGDEEDVDQSADRSGQPDMPYVRSRQLSPFQSQKQTSLENESDEEALQDHETGDNAARNKTSAMASELSLRHGLGEGKPWVTIGIHIDLLYHVIYVSCQWAHT